RAATTLLAQADSLDALNNLAHKLGFETPLLHVTSDALQSLGIHEWVSEARLSRGQGNRRLVSARLSGAPGDARELTKSVCQALVKNAPTRLWSVTLLDSSGNTLLIACASAHPNGARIAALRVDRRHIVDSDADTVRALASVPTEHDRVCHARWGDILKRDALSARFYRTLDKLVRQLALTAKGKASREERDELALLCASRLLFLAFLEAKGWLAGDRGFLLKHCAQCLENGGRLHERFLRPLFFGTLNTPINQRSIAAKSFGAVPFLNGGLFAPTRLEQQRRTLTFSDDAIVALIGDLLDRYRFTAREDSSTWSEAAVDPEMLGRAFECLMATDERRRSGSFYTPPGLVAQAVRDALCAAIPALRDDMLAPGRLCDEVNHEVHDTESEKARDHARTPSPMDASVLTPEVVERLAALHILDPACGSGAFLVHTLEYVADLLATAGDVRPTYVIRREVLTRSIFGVDRNPMAVWLCELRLWLSVVIECPETEPSRIPPLPNLDHNIRTGDTLSAGDLRFASPSARALTKLRHRYARATGRRKRTLAELMDTEERKRAVSESTRMIDATTNTRRELLENVRRRDLFGERSVPTRTEKARISQIRETLREQRMQRQRIVMGGALPFRFAAHFADLAAEGFDIVIGNPPWVRPHNLPIAERARLRIEYRTLRDAAWKVGAQRAGAGAGFAAQADLAVAFVERGAELLKPSGVLALLLPAKLWRSLAGGGVRKYLAETMQVQIVRDWSDAVALFDAAVYPSLLVATRARALNPVSIPATTELMTTPPMIGESDHTGTDTSDMKPQAARRSDIRVAITRGEHEHKFGVPRHFLSMGADSAAPWLLLPTEVRNAFERLRRSGPALGDSHLGRPLLGVKCGLNSAFLVRATEHDDDTATIESDGREYVIERTLLRPALRGDAITLRTMQPHPAHAHGDLRILWTHGAEGAPLRALPPRTGRWLARYRSQLESRKDARSRQPWWTLFRTEAARSELPRLVWADLGRTLRTTVLQPGDPTVPLNTCYVLRTTSITDAYALNTLLTSPVAAAWLDAIAEPARGGWRRFLGWTVAALPVPENWNESRVALANFCLLQRGGNTPSPEAHLAVAAAAYGIPLQSLLPLIHWRAR
ncbi:MAG: N-6 DNA methylase, partial [Gemmatimonas sp.]